jgi:hypothetical protein
MKRGTAPKIAKIASRVLDNPASSKAAKTVASRIASRSDIIVCAFVVIAWARPG